MKRTETDINSVWACCSFLAEIIYEKKISPPPAPPISNLSTHAASVVDSLMVISVRIQVLQNRKRSMTSSESTFHLYHS